jgi:hypothetical protein
MGVTPLGRGAPPTHLAEGAAGWEALRQAAISTVTGTPFVSTS